MAYDVAIIGAGHNGLVAAAYLARAGLRVLVLERRDVVGGAAVTEEIAPGFRVSTASYSLSLLRPDIFGDLDLGRHGLSVYPKDPQLFVPLPDGRHFFIWRDQERTVREIERINAHDSRAYKRWTDFWDEAVALLRPLADSANPPTMGEVEAIMQGRGRADIWKLAVQGSVAEIVSEFFQSDELRGALATQGLIGTFAGPHDPGTAWVMAFHALGGEINGANGTWAYARGGMGSVTRAIAGAAREAGAEIRTSSGVVSIWVEGERRGVVLEGGEAISAGAVLSAVDPKTTFLHLLASELVPEEILNKARHWRIDGCVLKVNLALNTLPDFISAPGEGPQHLGTIEIAPSLAYLDAAYRSAREQGYSVMPFMEVFIQSASDRSLAPEGSHVLSAFSQYIRPEVPHREWSQIKDSAFEATLEVLSAYAPNIRDSIVAFDVLGPPELEERFGLPGGDIFHGSLLPGQMLGERFPYRSGIPGVYLGGAGASPGGGVMGAPGRNAAAAILEDLKPR